MGLSLLLDDFRKKFGYEIDMNENQDLGHMIFSRQAEGNTHVLILEDHRWERYQSDFDPQRDVGDWLVFSYLTDDVRDWFGNRVDSQYPLTLSEYKMIERIIKALEEEEGNGQAAILGQE